MVRLSRILHRFGLLFAFVLLVKCSHALDLGDFNYTDFVDNIPADHRLALLDKNNPATLKPVAVPQSLQDLKAAGANAAGSKSPNQTATALVGQEGTHQISANDTALEIKSNGGWERS